MIRLKQPTYEDIQKFVDQLTDKAKGIYGITLRGKPGWGENMAFLPKQLRIQMPH
jgi:sorbitol/mannitol transport system substrate-binding protein